MMPRQLGLPAALRAQGLTVEVVPGWETRGSESFAPGGAVAHWTAGPRTGDSPSLRVCTYGRGEPGTPGHLPGPLCNVFLPRGLVEATRRVIVVAAGRANHAGKGGWAGMVGNSAVWGTEAESSGDGDWTDWQRWAYPRINAAYARLSGFDPRMVCGHNEWAPGRKIDIRDWPPPAMRQEVASILAGPAAPTPTPAPPGEDDDMKDDERQMLADIHDALMAGKANVRNEGYVRQQARLAREAAEAAAAAVQPGHAGVREAGPVVRLLASVQANVAALAGRPAQTLDAEALAKALADAVPDDLADRVIDALHKRTGPQQGG